MPLARNSDPAAALRVRRCPPWLPAACPRAMLVRDVIRHDRLGADNQPEIEVFEMQGRSDAPQPQPARRRANVK